MEWTNEPLEALGASFQVTLQGELKTLEKFFNFPSCYRDNAKP